jgi:hypothetical protein
MRRISLGLFAAAVAVLGCDSNTGPSTSSEVGRFTLVPITMPGATINAVGVSEDGVVTGDASFGADSSGVFQWKGGVFSFRRTTGAAFHAMASNNPGDLAGVIFGPAEFRAAVWYEDDSVPRLLTNADTLLTAGYEPTRINDRREVALFGRGTPTMWFNGQLADLHSTGCYPESLNNQGLEVVWGCVGVGGGGPASLYDSPFRAVSRSTSSRLAGRPCPSGSYRTEAINDSNETLGSFGGDGALVWRAAGCLEFRQVSDWISFNSSGLLLGATAKVDCSGTAPASICSDALLLNEKGSVPLDALIDAPSGSWDMETHVMIDGDNTVLTNSRLILTQAHLNGGPAMWVLLVPAN